MAFGTGLHPSTQLCLGFLETTLVPGSNVLDAGCGSGILSIAAAKLGSGPISAFDVDPLAMKATRENAALNGVDGQIEAWISSGPGDGSQWGSTDSAPRSWQLLLVNILLPVILELLDRGLARHLAPGGRMVLGGLIADQRPQLVEALHRHRLRLEQERNQGDWLGAVAIFDDNSPD
jgi:ribosomal protein L11 methyltransferase